MALSSIINPPASEEEFWIWAQAHAAHHYDCIRVMRQLNPGKAFDQYILDPFDPNNMEDWLNQHAQMHLEMDAALGVASYALSELNWQDQDSLLVWFSQNFAEHQFWATRLNLG